jgi:hypothetical protein
MDIVAHIAPIMIGLFAGYFLSSRVGVWAVSLLFSLRGTDAPAGRATRIKRIALLTLLHSGPWLVAVAALVAFYIRSKPWAVWALGGAFVGILCYLLAVWSTVRIVRRRKRENAAQPGR